MRVLSKLRSPWTVTMVGAVLDPQCDPVLVMEYMDLGSLYSILHSRTLDVDSESMHMMILDIVQGCRFLHASEPAVVHGDLKSMVGG
jgi:serine/threonine protein kinase